jgi:transketolase
VKGPARRTKEATSVITRVPRFLGNSGRVIGMRTFGALAHLKEMEKKFGLERERVVETAKEMLGKE